MDKSQLYDLKDKALRETLKPKLTDEFLTTLVDAVQTAGWSVDFIETASFVEWCYAEADKIPPTINPHLLP